MFQGQYKSDRRINLLFDEVSKHDYVIANLTGAMAKRYVCEACKKGVILALYTYASRSVATA